MTTEAMPMSELSQEWQRLGQIAQRIADGDSLAELVEALMEARAEFPMPAGGQADHPAFVVAKFIEATLTALVWERLGVDYRDRMQALTAYRAAIARGKPAEYRVDGRLTVDERSVLRVLAGYTREVEHPEAAD